MSLESRLLRLEVERKRAIDEALAPWAPKLDAAERAVHGAWGEAVRAHGMSCLAALDAGDPPLPAGVDPLVLGHYLEAVASAEARRDRTPPRALVEADLREMAAYVRGLSDEELLDAINRHPLHPSPPENQA